MKNKPETDYKKPIYLQLRDVIRSKIEDGDYVIGMAIPSENQLAETYGINRLTVRNAVNALVTEGLLKRVHGKGMYVLGEKMERDLETLGGFTQTIEEKNAVPMTKILTKTQRLAGDKYAQIFNIDPEDKIYYIKRVGYVDGAPLALDEIFLPCNLVPKLDGIDLSVFSLYEVYEFYGIHLQRAWQTLDIVKLEKSDRRILNITSEMGVFLFSCTSYNENDKVIEFSRSYTRGDQCNFNVSFHE